MNFNGAIGELHLKNKTKQPAQRTKMHIKTWNIKWLSRTMNKLYWNMVMMKYQKPK